MSTKHELSELIAVLSNGDFNAKATAELNKVVEAVEAGHGSGKVTITIGLKKEGRMVVLKPTVKATVPVAAVDSSMFFVDRAGCLTDEDPAQLTIAQVPRRPPARVVDLDANRKPSEAQAAPAGATNPDKTDKKEN